MAFHPADVQVCMPGRGCDMYVPLAGQSTQWLIDVGPHLIDAVLAILLIALLVVAAAALVLRLRRTWSVAPALLVVGGILAAIPALVPAVAPVAQLFLLASSACVGAGFVGLARRLPRPLGVLMVVLGGLRLLEVPVAVVQFAAAAPLGPVPTDVLHRLDGLALACTAFVLLAAGAGLGTLRWALLPLLAASLATAARLAMPFPAARWIDLLPPIATIAVGLLMSPVPTGAPGVRRRPVLVVTAVVASGLVAVFGLLLAPYAPPLAAAAAVPPPIGRVQVVTASTRLVLPLDAEGQPLADRAAVVAAENRLIRACAARSGVAAQAADLLPAPTEQSGISRLGLIGAERAAAEGYWSPHTEVSGGPLNRGRLQVLVTCVRAAQARIGDDGAAQLVVDRARLAASAATEADPRVRRLDAAWSRCMQLRGFAEPAPSALGQGQYLGGDGSATFPTALDLRAASADVACEAAAGLPGLRAAVLAAYERRIIATHASDLAAARAELATQLRLARAISQSAR